MSVATHPDYQPQFTWLWAWWIRKENVEIFFSIVLSLTSLERGAKAWMWRTQAYDRTVSDYSSTFSDCRDGSTIKRAHLSKGLQFSFCTIMEANSLLLLQLWWWSYLAFYTHAHVCVHMCIHTHTLNLLKTNSYHFGLNLMIFIYVCACETSQFHRFVFVNITAYPFLICMLLRHSSFFWSVSVHSTRP